eukprot:SAG31_NODE_3749_length_3922_cov_1.586144_1_plen_118_part_10
MQTASLLQLPCVGRLSIRGFTDSISATQTYPSDANLCAAVHAEVIMRPQDSILEEPSSANGQLTAGPAAPAHQDPASAKASVDTSRDTAVNSNTAQFLAEKPQTRMSPRNLRLSIDLF